LIANQEIVQSKKKNIEKFFYKIIDKILLCKNKNTKKIKVASRIKKSKENENIFCVIQNDRISAIRELTLRITKKREKVQTIVVFTTVLSTRTII